MQFAGIWEILDPFLSLRGAARRPKESPFQKGSRVFNMATSYYNISLDHLADHLIHLSSSSSFWFSLHSSYDNEFHLSKSKLLGITPQDYEFILVAASLAHFHKRWSFSIKMMKLKLFLEGHLFTTINCDGTLEVDENKVDLNAFMKGKPPKHRERVYSCPPLVAPSSCPLIVLGTTTSRGSRATGGTTTATGGTTIARGGTATTRGRRVSDGTTMATGGTTITRGGTTTARCSRATGGTTIATGGTTTASGSRVTGGTTTATGGTATGGTVTARGIRATVGGALIEIRFFLTVPKLILKGPTCLASSQ